jgi:hypothetical protein
MLVVQSELSGVEQSLASVRSASLDADVVARQWIPFGPALSARTRWLERTGRLRRSGREEQKVVILADNTQRRTVRVVAGGPVLVKGLVRVEMPDGSTVDSDRPQDSEHPKCWGHPARLSGARDAPAQCCPGKRVVPKRVQKQAAVPYPGSVWPATQASTWVQVRSSQGLN